MYFYDIEKKIYFLIFGYALDNKRRERSGAKDWEREGASASS